VILQTRAPEHPSLIAAAKSSFKLFTEYELRGRKQLAYPPFGRLLRVVALAQQAPEPVNVLQKLRQAAEQKINKESLKIVLLGPAPAPIEKIKGRHRWHILIKSLHIADLMQLYKDLRNEFKSSKRCRLVFDLDPQDML
jgi:primosomal protein N' (replication factor Y)